MGVRIVFDGWIYVCVDVDAKNRPIGKMSQWDDFYPIRRRLFGAGSSPMKVGMSCKSLEAQTPEDK